jgi:hypothetical protein
MAAPIITTLFPTSGPAIGGTSVNIGGTFNPVATAVTFGGIAATITTAFLGETIVTTPPHAAGTVDVVVTNADGSTTDPGAYTYTSIPPTVTHIDPPTGTAVGGAAVGITGTNFDQGVTGVTVGGVPATGILFVDAEHLIAFTGAHVAGVVDVAVTTEAGSGVGTGLYTYTIPPVPAWNVYLFDDCCHLWVSHDTGGTYVESATPFPGDNLANVGTLEDPWSDLLMAINDGDYSTMWGVDNQYNFGGFGIFAVSKQQGANDTWTLIDPEPGTPAATDNQDFFTEHVSGAFSANGVLLSLPNKFFDNVNGTGPFYPRISRDNGATWNDLTALGANIAWSRGCFSANAVTMYAKPSGDSSIAGDSTPTATILNPAYLFKSVNSGASWTQLGSGPSFNGTTTAADYEGQMRLRCSKNGQIVAMVNVGGVFWWSTDGGASWSNKDFNGFFPDAITTGTKGAADFGMSDDGQTFIVGFTTATDTKAGVALSLNGGISWNLVSLKNPSAKIMNFRACNTFTDGVAMVVTGQFEDFLIHGPDHDVCLMYANVSIDSGATWTLTAYFADQDQNSSTLGFFTSLFMVPQTAPPNPFMAPRAGYIIERLDNRLWPTVEDCWCVDCGFTNFKPTPAATLFATSTTGAGIITGVTNLIGGQNYSAATTVQVVDDDGLGFGSGAIAIPTITAGVITAINFLPGGSGYVYPQLVFNDPENTGSGASATVALDNSMTFTADAPVFAVGDIGSVIRAGDGVAVITAFVNSQQVTANLISPIAAARLIFDAGTWTMTAPFDALYLPALVGFTITGLADGQIIPPTLVPANGMVTLATPASAIIVGLAFQAQLQSTYLDAGEPTVQGQRKKVAEVTVRVEQSAGFQVGANQPDGSVQSPQELFTLWQNMVAAPTHAVAAFNAPFTPLFTGDIRVPIPGGWNTRGQVAVQQLQPLPLQVLDYVPETLGGDDPAQKAPARRQNRGAATEGQQ